MIRHEYLDHSAFGVYWIPCELIGEDSDGKLLVKYFQMSTGETVEEEVSSDSVRAVNTKITDKYLSDVAQATAQRFKDDLTIVDEITLEQIAGLVHKVLQFRFNFPE